MVTSFNVQLTPSILINSVNAVEPGPLNIAHRMISQSIFDANGAYRFRLLQIPIFPKYQQLSSWSFSEYTVPALPKNLTIYGLHCPRARPGQGQPTFCGPWPWPSRAGPDPSMLQGHIVINHTATWPDHAQVHWPSLTTTKHWHDKPKTMSRILSRTKKLARSRLGLEMCVLSPRYVFFLCFFTLLTIIYKGLQQRPDEAHLHHTFIHQQWTSCQQHCHIATLPHHHYHHHHTFIHQQWTPYMPSPRHHHHYHHHHTNQQK